MNATAPLVLVVEDEREIRELMALHLLRQGYRVRESSSVEEAAQELARDRVSLVVLDWMLPGVSGVEFLQKLKTRDNPPGVLMVTARTEPADIVEGLERGADDYLTKPFENSVFLARVKALLRRAAGEARSGLSTTIGGLTVNLESYDVTLDGERLHLTPSEFRLLSTMIQNRGKVMTRDQLIDQIQGEGISVVGRTIDTHVFGLRKKLGAWSDHIETIRGVGYRVKLEGD